MPNWLIYLLAAAIILLQAFLLKRRWGKMDRRQRLVHLGLISGVIGWVLIFRAEIEIALRTTPTANFQAHPLENRVGNNKNQNPPGNNVRRALELSRYYKEKDYPGLVRELEAEAKRRGWNVRPAAFVGDERYSMFLEKLLTVNAINTDSVTIVAANSFKITSSGEIMVDTEAPIEEIVKFLKE